MTKLQNLVPLFKQYWKEVELGTGSDRYLILDCESSEVSDISNVLQAATPPTVS